MNGGPLSYEPFFGLRKKPFSLASDPEFLYESPSHTAALNALIAGIRRREGLLAFTGDVGTGKTTICRAVLRNLDRTTFSAFIPDPFASREDLLRMLLIDFGVTSVQDITTGPLAHANRTQLSYLLSSFLDTLVPLDAFVVVFIDEAQNMSDSLIEEVRVLSDAFNRHGQLQLVFVGQLELLDTLKSPTMRQVDQRVSVYTRLDPLSADDVFGYVQHRLQVAGASANRPMFVPSALSLIHEASQGIPRVINRICDRSLQLAYERRSPLIDRQIVEDALDNAPAVPASRRPATPIEHAVTAVEPGSAVHSATSPVPDNASPLPAPVAARLQTESPATFARKVDAWLTDLDEVGVDSALSSEFVSEKETETIIPDAPVPFEAPLRRYKPERYIHRLARRWARAAAIGFVALVALNAVVAAASYVPAQLKAELRPTDLPPLPAPRPPALRPVVRPALAVAEAAVATTASNSTASHQRYSIAVGLFTTNVRAERLVQTLAADGFSAFTREFDREGRTFRHVMIGPFDERPSAEKELQRLRAAGDYADAHILPRQQM
jgi:general secretion pathway protein A